MARFLDGYTPKKKKKDEETQQKKAKSPSVSNNNYKRANQGSDYVSRKDGGQGSGLTRRTANKPTVNRQPSYVNRSNNQPMSRKDGGDGFQTSRRTQTQPQTSARTRTTPATSREWMSRKDGGEGTPRRTATERASDLGSRFAQQARTNRAGKVQDSQWTSRKEGGEGSYRPKTAEEMQRNRKRGFIDDAVDTMKSTLRQTAASEKQYLNTAARGITLKDRDLYATKNQIDEADRRTEERKAKYRSQIKAESAKMEKLKEGHSYLGRMGLDAVSSTTGMATDLAWGPASLAHMYMRSSGASQGDVREKVEPLKQKLRESGNYTDDEIEEMFKDVDKWDAANAMASAGIEALSEKLFPGIGIGRKVIGGKGASIAEKVMGRLATKVVNKSGVLGNVARGTLEEIAEEEVGGPLQAKAANLIYGNRLQAISDDNTRRTLQNQSDYLRSQIKTPEDAQAVAARLNSDEFYNESKQTYLDAGCTEKEADTLANLSRDYLTASLTGDTETMQKCQDKMVDILSEDQKEHFGLQDAIDSAVSTAMMTAATGAPGAITSTQIGNEYKKNAGMDAVRNLADIAVKYDPDNSIKAQTIRDMIDKGEDISGTQVHELIQIASKAATASFKREDAKDTTAERRMRHEGYLISPAVRAEDGSVILEEKTAERYDDIEAGYMEKAAGLSVPAEAADMAVNIATSYDLGVITAEQMNELSDKDVKEAFSDLTGINLNQYNVYDRKGNILVAESNIRMQNALFAKASDNLVESARLEQLNFDDKARGELIESVTRNTASNGAGAVAVAIQTVDTKDKSKMMLMGAAANRVYEMGMYTNQSWDDVRGAVARQFPGLDSDVLGLVFESGKADKAVQETEFYGRSVRAGEGMTRDSISDQTLVPGEVVNTTGRVIGADEMGFLKDTADNFGIKVVIEDVAPEEVKKENGKTVKRIKEGKYDSKSNTLYVNVNEDVRKPLRAIVTHELTHSTIFAPDEMLELIEYIGDAWYRADPEGYKAAIDARREIYKAQDLSDLELLEEIVADGSIDYDFWNDPTLLDDIATKNQTLAEKFLSAIREILRKLRTILANEPAEPQNEKQYTAMYAQVVDMAEAERLMMNALKAANKARADKAVSDWQDAVYAKDDTRDSISNAETDAESLNEAGIDITESRDAQVRFSMSEPVERVKDLIAVHNLKPEDIRNTFELGGFPMPSIAVTKDSMGHDEYGDITLMFHSDTIDPEFFRSNQVFGGDAWTPTFPSIAKKVSRQVADRIDQRLRDILGLGRNDYALGDLRLPALDDDNLTNALRYNEPYDAFKNDEVFQIAYLKNAKNFDIAVPTKEGRIRNIDKQALEYLDDNLPELTYNDIYDTVDHTMKYEPAVRKARKDYYENKGVAKLKALANLLDEEMGYSDVISRLEALIKFREEGIPEVTDRDALKSILDENVDQEGYKAWIDNLFEGIIEKTGIRNDKDMFTASGNRRSWESLHDPVTLENVVKVMKAELAAGGTGIFGSNPKGAAQKQYKSLDEIRADEGRLQNLSEEEYKAKSEEAVGKMSEVCIAIAEHNPKRFSNSFGAALDVGSDIAEILNSTRNRDTIQRKLKKDYWLDVTDEQMDDLMEAIDSIANLPTGYFEAKPRRAVGFDEVRAAIIPANTDADIKEGFSKRGITTYEYDPEVEGDRTAKVNDAASEQDLRFSISENSSGESLTEWQQEYFRNSKIVDEDGRLKIMYHGTPNMGFTVFDLKKAKPGTLGRGFYFTDSKTHAGNHGQQMEVYLNIENPLQPDTYDITKEQLRQFVAALAEDEDYGIDNYGYDATVDSVTDSVWGRSDFQMLHDLNLTCVGDLAEACRLFNYVNGTNYDGIVTAVETLAMRPEQIKLTDNLAPTSDPDIRFSVSDDEYFSAVEKYQQMYDANEWGWLQAEDEIQRMVDQAAVEAGYATKAYHGTDAEFNVFKRDYIAHGRLYGDGFYFSPLEEIAGSYGSNVKPYFLKTGVLTERELMSDYLAAQDYKDFADKDDAIAFSREKRQQFEKYGQGIERFRPDVDIVQGMYRVIYTTVGAFQNGYIMVATEPEYIKSADPIVKDDNGNVIPLSKRFNDNSVDTRFSISATDSQGNRLTEEQRQYFGNSQAVDDQGRLVPVYHTTNYGGFTVFDPSYSDDKRSLFFASNWNVSQTYGRNADRKYRFEEYSFKSLNDFAKAYAENFSNNLNDPENDILEQVVNALRIHIEKNSMPAFDLGDTMFERVKNYMKIAEAGDVRADKYRIEMKGAYGGMVRASSYDELLGKLSRQMSNNSSKSGYYECYLNLENPLIVDAQNQSWNNIPYGEYSEDAVLAIKNLTVQDMGDGIYVNIWGDRKVDGKWQEFRESDTIEFEYLTVDGEYEIPERAWDEVYDFLVKQGLSSDYAYEHSDAFFDFNGLDTFDKDGRKVESDVRRYRTRELAALADAKGYDSVIVRNCYDIGAASHLKGEGLSDIYIAFSSNQVKDINNENPTENPDIRYSIADDDETMSVMANDYAYDDSYEALAYYEQLFDGEDSRIADDKETDNYYQKAKRISEKNVNDFYDGLIKFADGMVFEDPVLEDGRARMARSRQDFFGSNVAKWNDRWLTEGFVLDTSSIRKPIRDLVKDVMQNSDTDRKFKSDLVNKTIVNVRLAYAYAKEGRTDVADALLWHTALRMIEDVDFIDDTIFNQYKDLRDYCQNVRIQLGEEYWSDIDYQAFRKANFGKINLVKGDTNVDEIYQEMQERWPEFFREDEEMTPPDQLAQIEHVLDSIQPYKIAYSSEEAADLATDIASNLMSIMKHGKEYSSIADVYKNRYDAKTKALKQRHEEALRQVKEQGNIKEQKAKAKFKEYKEEQKEKKLHDKYFNRIQKNYKWLVKRLQDNTKDSNIPEFFKKDLAKMLSVFDLQTEGSKKREARTGHVAKKTLQMEALRTSLEKMHDKYDQFLTNDVITDLIADITKTAEGKTIDALTPAELGKIDNLLRALRHEFSNYNKVRIEDKKVEYAGIGSAQVDSAIKHAEKFGSGKDYYGIRGIADRIINMDELTPAYLFRRIDPEKKGLWMMYGQLEDSHDRYIRNTVQIEKWMNEIVGKYHKKGVIKSSAGQLAEWRDSNHTKKFQLESGHVITLTPAQMMSIYCLAKRPQAKSHMVGAGVVISPVSFQAKMVSDVIKRANVNLPEKLTDKDIKSIVTNLTPDQIKVADDLQELMATKMAAWGNEASMAVLGIKLFTEKEYFPIRSDRAALTRDLDEGEFVQAIRNFGFTKAVQPGARNAIMVDDIFDVVTEHCNNMNLYNAYSEAMNDFMKVYNYRDFREDGSEYTVQQAVAHAYSQKATTFIMSFMKDLNGNVSGGKRTGINDAFNAALANAKKASVFANIRVAAQQPTAIGRAFMMISPKYIKAIGKPSKALLDEMFEHCPIAKWKSLGYYDINMGRNIESVIMNENNLVEELATAAYGALDNMTWGAIWQMVKAEVEDKNPNVKIGSDKYWDLCNKRMREVVAFTQVVDSPFHRSHAMRSKNFMDKLATAFGAEPTLTFNMVRDGYIRAYEMLKTGDKAGAGKLLVRTMSVFITTAVLTSAASALADVFRGKDPGDDDDEDGERTWLERWWSNFLNNMKDNTNLFNNIYYVKDIMSLLDGWEINNLAFQGWKYIGLGYGQLTGSKYARSKNSWWENIAYGIGYLTGVPVKTVMTDLGNLIGMAKEKFSIETPITDAWFEKLDSISLAKDDGKAEAGGAVIDVGADTEDLPDNLTDEQKDEIRKAGEKRKKKNSKKEEVADRDKNKMLFDAEKSAAGYEGAERDKRIWQSVSQGYKDHIANGDYAYIAQMRSVVEQAGGDLDYFDQRIMEASKSALKKTIEPGGADTESEMVAQQNIKMYLLRNGMSAEELSSEIVYKSAGAKDLKVAFRINDNYEIQATATSLIWAGLTADDYNRLYENRNRIDLKKYNGKYKDRLKSTGKYIWPASGPITSPYGYRNSPTRGASSFHQAIDIGAAYGSPVVAADGGTVIFAGWNGGGGKTVKIQHDDGSVTFYQHLSWWDAKVGDTVSQGQEIGKVGSTGVSTGPHLDFRVQVNGELVDPMKYLDKLN